MAKKLYGTDPDQVPTNADLGTMAYQDKDSVTVDTLGVGTRQQDAENLRLLVAHDGHGIGIDYIGTLPAQAGIYTSNTAHTQTAYGDLNIKARTDYGGYYGIGFFTASSNDTPVRRAYFNSTGNLVFESGKGIDFSASAGGGASSSVLDDYEEGTWTPNLSSATGTWVTSGTYIKVGSIVVATFRANPSGTAGVTANTTNITNLPFTIKTGLGGAGYVGVWTDVSASNGVYSFHTTGGTVAYFAGTLSTSGIIAGTLTYEGV